MTWHLDKNICFVRGSKALLEWLPIIGAEIILLVTFLFWVMKSGDEYHGFAVVFTWIAYSLVALALPFFWTEPAEKESAHGQDHDDLDRNYGSQEPG